MAADGVEPLLAAAHRWKRARTSGLGADEARQEAEPATGSCSIPAPTRVHFPSGLSVWCHAPPEALHIHEEIYTRIAYMPADAGLQLPATPGALVVDAGANIGMFALWVANRAQRCQVLAIEPATPSFKLLQRNVEDHGLGQRIACVQAALGEAHGSAELTWYSAMPGNATLFPSAKEHEVRIAFRPERHEAMLRSPGTMIETCEVSTLSQILRARGHSDSVPLAADCAGSSVSASQVMQQCGARPIALLKIDVEGGEVSTLKGIEAADWQRIEQVVVETHSVESRLAVLQLLRRHYKVVGEVADDELEACGLDRKVVYARSPAAEPPPNPDAQEP